MRNIITAIGNEELNNILNGRSEINIVNPDIQYQEGIIEAIEMYPNIDMVILSEDIIGNLELEDLLRSIIIMKNDVEIIVITEQLQIFNSKNIVKVVNDKKDYVDIIAKILLGEIYITNEKETKKIEKEVTLYENKGKNSIVSYQTNEKLKLDRNKEFMKKAYNKIRDRLRKNKKEKQIISVIGSSGSRKNNIYFYYCKIY